MNTKVTPGEIVVMAGAAVALVFSFLPFYNEDLFDPSAWGGGVFPVGTLIAIFAVIAGVLVALTKFASFKFAGVLGFTYLQLLLVLTFYSAILAVAFLILDYGDVGADRGVGFWFMLIGAVGSLVGAILMQNEARTGATGPPRA